MGVSRGRRTLPIYGRSQWPKTPQNLAWLTLDLSICKGSDRLEAAPFPQEHSPLGCQCWESPGQREETRPSSPHPPLGVGTSSCRGSLPQPFCHLFWGGGTDLTISTCPPSSERPSAALLTCNIPPGTHRFFFRSSFLSELEALCPPTSKRHLAPTFLLQPFLHPQSSFPPKGDTTESF